MISVPRNGETILAGEVAVRGYAIGAAGLPVQRVEVSPDGGRTFQTATLLGGPQPWVWRLWEARLHLGRGSAELVVRAWDEAGHGQHGHLDAVPKSDEGASHAWHRVRVEVVERAPRPAVRTVASHG